MTTDVEQEILAELKDARVDRVAIKTDVTEIKIVLKGYNGIPGVCKDVTMLKNFRRWVLIIFAFSAGGGGLGFGTFELLKFIKG